MTDERPATAWGSIAVLFACGVVAAMQMGRTVAIPTLLIESLGLSLAALGWAFSMITAVAAAGGLLAGGALQRLGIQRAMPFGLIWLSGSIALGSFATTGGWMLAGRALEGVGYLAIVVAAPTLMSVLAAPKHRPVVLAIWATFVPAGIFLGSLLGGWVASELGWRGWFRFNAGITLGLAILVAMWRFPLVDEASPDGPSAARSRLAAIKPALAPRPVALTLGFMAAVVVGLSANAMLPAYLVERFGFGDDRVGALIALLPIGSMIGSVLLGAWVAAARSLWPVISLAIVTAIACVALFVVGAGAALVVGAGVVLMAGHGALIAVGFALVPQVARSRTELAAVNGLIVQLGSLGNFLGPPAAGAVGDVAGWPAVGIGLAATALATAAGYAYVRRARPDRSTAPIAG